MHAYCTIDLLISLWFLHAHFFHLCFLKAGFLISFVFTISGLLTGFDYWIFCCGLDCGFFV
jgi:hypothetical protein